MLAFPSTTSKPVSPAEFAFATTTAATAVCALLGSLVVRVVSVCADIDAMTMLQDNGDYENEIALSMLVVHEEDDEEQYDVETEAAKSDTTIDEDSATKSTQVDVVAESKGEGEEDDFETEDEDDDEMLTRHHCTTPNSDDEGSEFDTITNSSSASSCSEFDYYEDVDEELDPKSSSSSDLEVDESHHTPVAEEDRDTAVATAAATELKDLRAIALCAENRELSRRLRQVQSKALKYTDSPEYQLTRAANLARRAKLPVNPKLCFKC